MIFKNHISTPSLLLMALDSQVSALNKPCLLSVPAQCSLHSKVQCFDFFDQIEPSKMSLDAQ